MGGATSMVTNRNGSLGANATAALDFKVCADMEEPRVE
ncbi:hypothetical protein AK973_4059 [Pseudomonas brassicacearum]|nr:hypothetical protein AK973_4059 [Pseudomonas brassicacearum]